MPITAKFISLIAEAALDQREVRAELLEHLCLVDHRQLEVRRGLSTGIRAFSARATM
jgi:hypothetical protein